MKKIILMIIAILSLSGCGNPLDPLVPNKFNIPSQNKVTIGIQSGDQDDFFLKKQECSKHKEEVEKFMKEQDGTWGGRGGIITGAFSTLDRICYSEKLNTCLAFFEQVIVKNGNATYSINDWVYDIFSGKGFSWAQAKEGNHNEAYFASKKSIEDRYPCVE